MVVVKNKRGGGGDCCSFKGGRRKRKTIRRRRKSLKKRKTKRRRRRRRKSRKKRGGGLLAPATFKCNASPSIGEHYTGIKHNTNPHLPDPQSSNKNMKGGGLWMDDFGLGDVLLNWYKGSNAVSNIPIRYKGGKPLMKADPMHQPNMQGGKFVSQSPNVPAMYDSAAQQVASNSANTI